MDNFLGEIFSNNGIFVVKKVFVVIFLKINFVDKVISFFKQNLVIFNFKLLNLFVFEFEISLFVRYDLYYFVYYELYEY